MHHKITLISMRMRSHAGASGYDRLAEYMDARMIQPVPQWTFARRALTRSLRFLVNRSNSVWYHRVALYSELCAARKWFCGSRQIFHFLYGENSYRYLGILKSSGPRNYVVCTYHTPPEKFRVVVRDKKHLSTIDAVIIVSNSQKEFFSKLVGSERVFFVPHGIDVDYFRPKRGDRAQRDNFRLLFVGSHLRDFETLSQTARFLNRSRNEFHLAIVTSPKFHHYFQGINNVELYSGISDEKLLSLYQDSDVLALPLLNGTANNSLLEAMACGLPIVSTDLPGPRDYVNESCALLTPRGNPQALAESILYLKENEVIHRKMALASRRRSLDFSWQRIAYKTQEVYERVCS